MDQGREDARLRRIAEELAEEEETQRQWRVARGQVGDPFMCHNNAAQVVPGLLCCSAAKVHGHSMWGIPMALAGGWQLRWPCKLPQSL